MALTSKQKINACNPLQHGFDCTSTYNERHQKKWKVAVYIHTLFFHHRYDLLGPGYISSDNRYAVSVASKQDTGLQTAKKLEVRKQFPRPLEGGLVGIKTQREREQGLKGNGQKVGTKV
jgi:hypothetical protein